MNNTFNNASLGSKIIVTGTTASAMASAINSASIYGVSALTINNKVVITSIANGPFNITETDSINTPLANVGISSATYGNATSNLTVINGNVSNPSFSTGSSFYIGTNWNSILNALPKASRKAFKCIYIAQVERRKVGTNSYRILNTFSNTVSPVSGHPWSTTVTINYIGNASLSPAPNGTNKIFTITNSTVSTGSLLISINGIIQTPGATEDYTVSGQTVTFNYAPAANATMNAFYVYASFVIAGYYTEQLNGLTNGVNTTFAIPSGVPYSTSLRVYYNGTLLVPITDYTVSGQTITTNFIPLLNSTMVGSYRTSASTNIQATFVDCEIPTGSGTTYHLVYTPVPSNYTQIFYNGTLLELGNDYSLTGNTITFNFTPAVGATIYAFYVYGTI